MVTPRLTEARCFLVRRAIAPSMSRRMTDRVPVYGRHQWRATQRLPRLARPGHDRPAACGSEWSGSITTTPPRSRFDRGDAATAKQRQRLPPVGPELVLKLTPRP